MELSVGGWWAHVVEESDSPSSVTLEIKVSCTRDYCTVWSVEYRVSMSGSGRNEEPNIDTLT